MAECLRMFCYLTKFGAADSRESLTWRPTDNNIECICSLAEVQFGTKFIG